jgi:hypothetical protein
MSDRRNPRSAPYHLLPLHLKQKQWLATARQQATRCPQCSTQLVAADLPGHQAARCTGSVAMRDASLVTRAKP